MLESLPLPSLEPAATPPLLPEKWHAIALLTPFTNNQLIVADITYDWTVQAMRITCYGLEYGYIDLLITQQGFYQLSSAEPGGFPNQCSTLSSSNVWQVPSPDWLSNKNCVYKGNYPILGTPAQWWVGLSPCTNCYEDPNSPKTSVGNWLWFREDNQYPWRMMFINSSNPYQLPVLGEFAMVHLPTFEAVEQTNLPAILQLCAGHAEPSGASEDMAQSPADALYLLRQSQGKLKVDPKLLTSQIQSLIPGLSYPTQNYPLPYWPPTLYMTAITVPTAGTDTLPTQIFYDWDIKRQLTRLYQPDGSVEDLILTDAVTYGVTRYPDGSHQCEQPEPPGLPYPNWVARDQGLCRGVIVDNPDLSPGKTTMLIVLESDHDRVFWIWYTTDNQAVMFTEVPQLCDVSLVLIDYYGYQPNVNIDPSVFQIPPDCLNSPSPAAGG